MSNSGRWSPQWRPLDHDPQSIVRRRLARGLLARQLAEQVGISPSYLSEIENGRRSAHPALLLKIAKALECPVSALERKIRRGRRAA